MLHRCRRPEGSNNMLERSGWWQRYRLPRCVRMGAAVAGMGIVKGASVVRCASEPVAVSGLHHMALQPDQAQARSCWVCVAKSSAQRA